MRDETPSRPAPDSTVESTDKDLEPAFKKTRVDGKGVGKSRDARLGAALRENLRRRKAAERKE
jgi:hypothetical protein